MSKSTIALAAGMFGMGFAVAWMIRSDTTAPVPDTEITQLPSKTAVQTETRRFSPRVMGMAEAVSKAGYDSHKFAEAIQRATPDDYPEMLGIIMKKGGAFGLESTDQEALRKLLAEWAKADPDAALDWILRLPSDKDRSIFLQNHLRERAKTDFHGALALLQAHGMQENGGWAIPYEITRRFGTEFEAADFVRVLGAFISEVGGGGSDFEFSDDFDFRTAADGLASLKKNLESGQSLASTPSNLIRTWTQQDPEAAWEWLNAGNSLMFNDYENFFDAYHEVSTPQEFTEKLVEVTRTSAEKNPTTRMIQAWQSLSGINDPAVLDGFLTALPGDPVDNLKDLFRTAQNGAGDRFDRFNVLLIQNMSAEERVQVLSQVYADGTRSPERQNLLRPVLKHLGHTDEEIATMLPGGR